MTTCFRGSITFKASTGINIHVSIPTYISMLTHGLLKIKLKQIKLGLLSWLNVKADDLSLISGAHLITEYTFKSQLP